jgi:hypothetical protein
VSGDLLVGDSCCLGVGGCGVSSSDGAFLVVGMDSNWVLLDLNALQRE